MCSVSSCLQICCLWPESMPSIFHFLFCLLVGLRCFSAPYLYCTLHSLCTAGCWIAWARVIAIESTGTCASCCWNTQRNALSSNMIVQMMPLLPFCLAVSSHALLVWQESSVWCELGMCLTCVCVCVCGGGGGVACVCVDCFLKGSVEWSRHERHFCSLLPYFLLSWLKIFQLCLSFWTSSFDMVLFKKFLQEKEKHPKNLPKRLSSLHLHSLVNRAETWYTASTHPSAKYVVTKFLISL